MSVVDVRPLITAFFIVLELNVFGLISLRYCPRFLVSSLLLPLLLSFSFAGLLFPLRDLLSRAILSRLLFTGFGFFQNKSTFRNIKDNHRAIIRFVSFDICSRIRLNFVPLTSSRFLDPWSFPHLFVLMMVLLILISRCTIVSLLLCCARSAVSVALGFRR